MTILHIRNLRWMVSYWRRELSPRKALRAIRKSFRAWLGFWKSYQNYSEITFTDDRPSLDFLYPCIYDATTTTLIEPTYFYQDAWAFEHIVKVRPPYHVDVGSHHKYVALLSKVLPVTMVDIRPLSLPLDSLTFRQGSILTLPYEDGTVPSVSSLCVVEHIGLGRYGDPLDPKGTEKALAELKRIVTPGGDLYLSIPIDDENRTYFNAHRAFSENYLMNMFKPFNVVERRYIFGNEFCSERRSGFGTGCYWLRKPVE
jgi:SAM-dependent methyltransferase